MSNSPTFDPSIPVLTEVFKDEPARPGSGPADLTPLPDAQAQAIDDSPDLEWRMVEQRLAERITREVSANLQPTIEKIVAEAVALEMAHLKALQR